MPNKTYMPNNKKHALVLTPLLNWETKMQTRGGLSITNITACATSYSSVWTWPRQLHIELVYSFPSIAVQTMGQFINWDRDLFFSVEESSGIDEKKYEPGIRGCHIQRLTWRRLKHAHGRDTELDVDSFVSLGRRAGPRSTLLPVILHPGRDK